MGRPTNKEARRAQLADALVGLLAQGSFADATISSIARAAGLLPGLVHHYFTTKDEVLALAMERLSIQLEVRLDRRLRGAGEEPVARIDACIDAWLALGDDADPRAALAWVAIGEEARLRPEVRTLYTAALARSRERLGTEIARALPPRHRRRAAQLAEVLVLAIEGALRVGAAGGLLPGTAAPLLRATARALLSQAGT